MSAVADRSSSALDSWLPADQKHDDQLADGSVQYPLHRAINTTMFYVGEPPTADNCCIPNDQSAWDGRWQSHYGGVDDPNHRRGFLPGGFTPQENPFYVALPYNDFTDAGGCRPDFATVVPWASGRTCDAKLSVVKNRWVEVRFAGVVCYGQWEDSGPYFYDDGAYVFGNARPKNETDPGAIAPHSGLDLSPAMRDCLGVAVDGSQSDWRFIESADVPSGPWRNTITTRQVDSNPAVRDGGVQCVCPAACVGQC